MCKYGKKCKKCGIKRYCCTYINIESLQLTISFDDEGEKFYASRN